MAATGDNDRSGARIDPAALVDEGGAAAGGIKQRLNCASI
jgi:hypothetical protein